MPVAHKSIRILLTGISILSFPPLSWATQSTEVTSGLPEAMLQQYQRNSAALDDQTIRTKPTFNLRATVADGATLVATKADDWGKQQIWIRKGQDAVRAKLKDSESAKFKDVYFHRGRDGIPMTCGLVNAKNGFGGYNGYKHFVSAGSAETTFLESEVADFKTVWKRLCTN